MFHKRKPERTVLVSLVSKAFDSVNIHKLISKLLQTNIPNNIIKFLSNYLKGRLAFTVIQNIKSKKHKIKTGVPHKEAFYRPPSSIYTCQIFQYHLKMYN